MVSSLVLIARGTIGIKEQWRPENLKE